MTAKPRLLITGGAGFVGTNLCELLQNEFEIRVLDNLSTGSKNATQIKSYVEFVAGDITDEKDCLKALEDIEYVVHLAAKGNVVESMQSPMENLQTNVVGTVTLLKACAQKNIKRFVFSSTGGALMGNCEIPVSEKSIPRPISPYGASKLACEGYISAFSNGFGIPATVLRFGNVYGRYCQHKVGVFNKLLEACCNDTPINIFGDGLASRDFVHVKDICQAIHLSLTTPQDNLEVFHIGTEIETNILGLIHLFEQVTGKTLRKQIKPERPGEVRFNFSTPRLAIIKLGYKPKYELLGGITDLWQWYKGLS